MTDRKPPDWRARAANTKMMATSFVDGRALASTSAERYESINPADETVLCELPVGDPRDVDAAVIAARRSVDDRRWSALPANRRAAVLQRLADRVVEESASLALLDTVQMGKPIAEAIADATGFAPDLLRSWAAVADQLRGAGAPLRSDEIGFNVYEPRGVVGAIAPWNFPLVNAVYKMGPALAAGNSLVLKPSELSPGSALRLAELAIDAGVPEGVFNVVIGLGATVGAALASHPDVDMVSFTGSTVTGRRIMELSGASNAKPVLLECGGKSPHVVFADIGDLDRVADAVVRGAFWNQGQVCSAHTRLIVHASVSDALAERVVARAANYQPGDPFDGATRFGPLASPRQRDRVASYIDAAVRSDARPLLVGEIRRAGGCFVSPSVFECGDAASPLIQDEIFGPVLTIQTFTLEEEAVALANGTDYGLSATIWTRDIGTGRRLAHAVRAGSVAIRTSGEEGSGSGHILEREPQKASGFGSELGLRGLQSYSTLKAVTIRGA